MNQLHSGFKRDEQGVTPVIAAVLIFALITIALGVFVTQVLPGYEEKNEADHMRTVREKFVGLQTDILARDDTVINLPMTSAPTPVFDISSPPSKITVTPARAVKRFQPEEYAWVDQSTSGVGYNNDYLRVKSYKNIDTGTSYNRRTYLKFDLENNLWKDNIDSEDIVEAWLVLYCENMSKYPYPMWGPGNPKQDWKQSEMPDMPIYIEARESGDEWGEGTIDWDNQPWQSPDDGDFIRALTFPNENEQGISENEVWYTWEVTTWVREQLRVDNVASFLMKPKWENSTQIRYANFTSSEGNGPPANLETGHPPYPKPHLTIIYENVGSQGHIQPGVPVSDNWGPFIEGGSVRFLSHYNEFTDHSFTFESGALVQQQFGFAYDLMISDPGMIVGERSSTENEIEVYVNRYRVINRDELTTSADAKMYVTVTENDDYKIDDWRENLLITVHTDFEWQWKYYFRDLVGEWNSWEGQGGFTTIESGFSSILEEPFAKFFVNRNIRLYVQGPVHDASESDIHYIDRTFDVEVEPVVE